MSWPPERIMTTNALTLPRFKITPWNWALISVWAIEFLLAFSAPKSSGGDALLSVTVGGVLVGRHIWSVSRQKVDMGGLELAVMMPLFGIASHFAFSFVNCVTPVTYDSLLASWDFGISHAVRVWCLARPWAMWPVVEAYKMLPVTILLAVLTTTGRTRTRLMFSVYLGALLCIPLYILCPAVGPVHVGDPNAPRNCMPSMHLTWALLMFINSKGLMRYATGIFLFLTAVATLATGEHYVVDLIAALPWTALITYLVAKAMEQWSPEELN